MIIYMEDKTPLKLTDQDFEIIDLLQSLNVPRTQAITIACLMSCRELTSQTIERAAGLRQPEVSVAMRTLRRRGWIEERDEKKTNNKGRPLKYYMLTLPMRSIIETFESEYFEKKEEMIATINQLKEIKI